MLSAQLTRAHNSSRPALCLLLASVFRIPSVSSTFASSVRSRPWRCARPPSISGRILQCAGRLARAQLPQSAHLSTARVLDRTSQCPHLHSRLLPLALVAHDRCSALYVFATVPCNALTASVNSTVLGLSCRASFSRISLLPVAACPVFASLRQTQRRTTAGVPISMPHCSSMIVLSFRLGVVPFNPVLPFGVRRLCVAEGGI